MLQSVEGAAAGRDGLPDLQNLLGRSSPPIGPDNYMTLCTGNKWRICRKFPILPQALRNQLLTHESDLGLPAAEQRFDSSDGTRRYLLRLEDNRTVEAVLMPEENRDTICISSQVGCPVDCKFCLTALMGLERNLTAGEIVGQVLHVARENGLRAD